MFTRFAYEDVEIAGHGFQHGDEIALLLGAANRDPRQFDQPNTFDPNRVKKPHTSFGAGVHFCIGAPLARLEMEAALPVLFNRFADLRIAAPPQYADRYHFHGLKDLIVAAT